MHYDGGFYAHINIALFYHHVKIGCGFLSWLKLRNGLRMRQKIPELGLRMRTGCACVKRIAELGLSVSEKHLVSLVTTCYFPRNMFVLISYKNG